MANPREIFVTPFEVYKAPVGEAFPLIDATPAGNWAKIGSNSYDNYNEDGVTISFEQEVSLFKTAGTTGPVKASRVGDMIKVRFVLWDMSLGQFSNYLNSNIVTDTPADGGTAGYKTMKLYRTPTVSQLAILVRGAVSAYAGNANTQFQFPVCVSSGSSETVYRKSEPAGIQMEYTVLVDPNAATEADRYGSIVMEDAD